jgi:hypothetical protein
MMGWACNSVATIGGRLRRGLLGFRATDNNETAALFFAVED